MKPGTRLVSLFSAMVCRLPLPVALACGRGLGRLAWWLLPSRRRVTHQNIIGCFPELDARSQKQLARAALVDAGAGLVECLLAWRAPSARWAARFRLEGIEHLRACPRPQLVLMAHYSCVELASRIVNEALEDPAAMVVRRQPDPRLEAWIDAGRRGHADQTIGKKDLRAMLKALRNGGRLMYAPDQNFSYRTVFVPFFGIPAATLTATADLAARTGAKVVPVWAYRERGGRYLIEVDEPWEGFPSDDAEADATRVNAWLEQKIRRAPEQYLWAHRRFRSRPPGSPPFYSTSARRAKHR